MAIAPDCIDTREVFVAAEGSPSAPDALLNLDPDSLIVLYSEHAGSLALSCIKSDHLDPESAVILDDTVEPPELHLRNAIAVTVAASFNAETGETAIDDHQRLGRRIINGIYTGPGSELTISLAKR